jgi:ABC-type branched-subunit amino acid transport system substrate-binding protein
MAADSIKVGVLHSLSGTMAISKTTLKDTVLMMIEELNGLLFYPVQYEGEESSKNVFYTGAASNQQAIPAVDYLMSEIGVKRWVLAGTDYVYPRKIFQW